MPMFSFTHPRPPATPRLSRFRLALSCAALAFLALTLTACKPMTVSESSHATKPPFTAASDLSLLSAPKVLPRNISLKAFDPHRDATQFSCRLQAEQAPALTAEAQALHEEAMTLTSPALWPNERNWPRAMQLWQQAAALGHWKAALMWLQTARTGQGLNSEKGQFQVPRSDAETVVAGMETLMRQGVADAFFWMGAFHETGYGVNLSADRAWAFWELAADLGSPLAQTKIAKALGFVDRAQERPNVAEWANHPLMFKLFECAHSQGYEKASYELGRNLAGMAKHNDLRQPRFPTPEAQYQYALQVLHDGVKFGSEAAANYLFVSFDDGEPLVNNFIDKSRARRYKHLANALWDNPDLRFPNLDRVIPLPPAKLPQWNGDVDQLIDAAKAVRVKPVAAKTAGANAPGRARIPEGHALVIPESLRAWAQRPIVGYQDILSSPGVRTGLAVAAYDGYYQPLHLWATHPQAHPRGGLPVGSLEVARMKALAEVPPLQFARGQALNLRGAYDWRLGTYFDNEGDHQLVYWRYAGQLQAVRPIVDHLARSGAVRSIAQATDTRCTDAQSCPVSGIWQPEVRNAEHPLAQVFNASLAGESWRRQAFVPQGQRLPSLTAQLAPVLGQGEAAQLNVQWRLMAACEAGFEEVG